MELKINDKKEQPMLSRIEIKGSLSFEGATPSAAEVKKALSSELKVEEGLIAVKNIFTHFGAGKADFIAFSYLNKEDMGKIEPKPKKEEKKEAPKEGAAPAKEAPKTEPPKEAPKEEKKAEPKEEKKEAPKEAEKKE